MSFDDQKPSSAKQPQHTRRPPDSWDVLASRLLKAEMERRNLTYSELALKLEKQGYGDNAGSLTSRINRGTFTLAFALRVLDALGVHELKWAEEPQRSWTTRRKDRSEREDGSGS